MKQKTELFEDKVIYCTVNMTVNIIIASFATNMGSCKSLIAFFVQLVYCHV